MSEWQPIETAPKDGSSVLAYAPLSTDPHRADKPYRILPMRWDESQCWRTDIMPFVRFSPTHWMPLPAPPEPA